MLVPHTLPALQRTGLLVASAVVLSSCSTLGDGAAGPAADLADGDAVEQVQPAPGDDTTASALEDLDHPSFPEPLVPLEEIRSGGPPPDGIPPLDDPTFERAGEVAWLEDSEPVLSLTVQGETRAYPLQVMTWHEIVNDTVGGVPVAVTYCPLCNSGVAFERTVDGRVLTFGTSGKLYADNLVMYDRQTESLWPQLTGQASVGVLTGTQLTAIPMGIVGWSQFESDHPDARVLSRDTGFDRPYGQNPYVGYDTPNGRLLFPLPEGSEDARLPVKERVIGIGEQDPVAVVRDSLAGAPPLQLTVDEEPVVVWHAPGQATALGGSTIARNVDVGTVGVHRPRARGRDLTFRAVGEAFEDDQTGSTWSVTGRAVAGPLAGARLQPVRHLDTFWFSWVVFHPGTTVVTAD